MNWSIASTTVVALAGMALSYVVAERAQKQASEMARLSQKTARDVAKDQHLTERASAFRDDQVAVLERVLHHCLDLLPQVQAISQRWLSGTPQEQYKLPPDSGPGIDNPQRLGSTTHDYHGIDMYVFHMQCRNLHLDLNRIDEDVVREAVRSFVGRVEDFRLIESVKDLAPEILDIQKALDDLFRRGGTYLRDLTAVDGVWYRSVVRGDGSSGAA